MIGVQKVHWLVKQPLNSTNKKHTWAKKNVPLLKPRQQLLPLQKHSQQLHKIQPSLTIITIAVLCYLPLSNTFCIWDILQNVKLLCKYPNNKGQMGNQPITKLWFHESQRRKTAPIFHITHYLHHGHFNQFHIFWGVANNNSTCYHQISHPNQRLVSKGGAMHVPAFYFIVNLNMPY